MWKAGSVTSNLLKFLTLPAKDGSWKPPEQLLFGLSYGPEHRLEELRDRGLFDQPFGYVDHLPAVGATSSDLDSWRRFLSELGVDEVLRGGDAPRVSQRVGVLCALRFERERGWTPKEIEESVKLGYDIESSPPRDGEVLRIEAKGSQSASPILHLTVNEFRALSAGPESYAAYIVTNAWSNPELHVVRGNDLVEEGLAYSVDIAFEKWRRSSTSQVRFP
jgi:hypothetical protein